MKRIKGKQDNNRRALILFLLLFHLLLNLAVRTISFATDEFIPVAIAAHYAGLDWMGARKFNYYYGYMTLLFFIPFFKIPFIYRNPFLLSQFLAGVNTFFYVIMAARLYDSINLLDDSRNRKQAFWITLISVCCLQVFNIGFGAQVEGLFCLSYMMVFYCLAQMVKGVGNERTAVAMAFFTGIAIINNSRGLVLLIATGIVLAMLLLTDRKKIKEIVVYIAVVAVMMGIHRYVIKPSYMQFFMTGAANTDSGSFLSKLKLTLGEREYFGAFIRVVIGWLWAFNASTLGFFFLAAGAIGRRLFSFWRRKDIKGMIIPAFILLNIVGILLLCSVMCVISAHDLFVLSKSSRADLIIYTRYFAAVTSVTMAYGIYAFVTEEVLKTRKEWLISGIVLYLSCKIFQVYVAPGMDGFQYGVNNTVFISLFLRDFQDSHRYGFVHEERFLLLHLALLLFLVMMRRLAGRKDLFLKLFAVFSAGICVIYCFVVVEKRSDYYTTVLDEEMIQYCLESDKEAIYVSHSMAPVAQYLMPDKKLYFQQNEQELYIVGPEKEKDVDLTQYREIMRTSSWILYEKTDSFTKIP